MGIISGSGGQVAPAGSVSSPGAVEALSHYSIIADTETWTSDWVDVSLFDSLVVSGKTDQDGIGTIQFSPDGTNADSTLTRYFNIAQIEAPHRFTITRKYARITFNNNSGAAQTYFRLQTLVGDKQNLNIPIDAVMAQDYDSIAVRNIDFTPSVAVNRVQGWEVWNKFGYNLDIDSAAAEVVASFGGTFSRMTSADTLDIVSSSANDANGGTGVNSIVIYGIDENRDPVTAVYNMNGTTTVTTTGQQFYGVNRVAVFLFGSGERNAGTITITATTAGSTQAQIPVGTATTSNPGGVTQQMIFHVPRNYNFLASWLRFNVNKIAGGGSPRVTLRGIVYSAINNGYQEVYSETIDTSVENFANLPTPEPFVVTEQTILFFVASTDTNNTIVTGRFSGKLVRDVDA